ncbi:MAG TPA: hypothetical protein DCY07_05365 [Rhodospirillaceae bacterium]|nr:hypothetical protein [Rhodospirillaceae bacterium]
MEVNFVTLNISRSQNLKTVLAFKKEIIKRHPHTIFAFQEVDINAKRSGNINVAEALGEGCNYFFSQTMGYNPSQLRSARYTGNKGPPWRYGHCIVSTLPIAKGIEFLLSHEKWGSLSSVYWKKAAEDAARKTNTKSEYEPRTATLTRVIAGKKEFYVTTTHLALTEDPSLSSSLRRGQMAFLIRKLRNTVPRKMPLIVMGDFNATQFNPDLRALHRYMNHAPNAMATQKTSQGNISMIDHIFYRNALAASEPQVMDLEGYSPGRHPMDRKALMIRIEI